MQQPQQTHHQIVEEILPEQMSDEVTKEVINQFLPQRKRKPRATKSHGKQNPAKVIKLEPQASGSEQTVTTIIDAATGDELTSDTKEQVTEMIETIEEHTEQSSTDVKIKTEGKASKDKSSSKIECTNKKCLCLNRRIYFRN
jgi:NAD(P)H-hydrate repair Nnr-like enzyme with NAD(P)H-hydrate epimerase domain